MNRLHKNFALLTASNLLSPFFSMVLVLAISRLRGVEMLGKYSLMMTVFVIGQSCVTFGLPVIVTREVAQAHEGAGRHFMAACAVTGVAVFVGLALVATAMPWLVSDQPLRLATELVLVALLPTIIIAYGEAVLLAFERAGDFVALNLLENTVRAVTGTAVVLLGGGIVGLAVVLLAVRVLTSAAFVLALRRRDVALSPRIDPRLCMRLVRYMPVLGAIPIVNAFYARADVLLLTWFGTWTEVGLYSAGLRLVDMARSVPPAYARALYPVLSRLRLRAPDEFRAVAHRAIRNILLLMVPAALLLSTLATPIMTLLYGAALAPAADALRVLAWVLVPMGLASTLAQMLFAADKQVLDLRVNLIATAVSVGAGLALIPHWGAIGAAVAVLLSGSVYAVLQYVFVCRAVVPVAAVEQIATMAVIALPSALLMWILSDRHLVVGTVTGLAAYILGLAAAGIVTRRDLARIRLSLAGMHAALR